MEQQMRIFCFISKFDKYYFWLIEDVYNSDFSGR